jgi:hypothetical protein
MGMVYRAMPANLTIILNSGNRSGWADIEIGKLKLWHLAPGDGPTLSARTQSRI